MEKKHVKIVEVGLRDGFQNLPEYIPLEEKLRYMDGLVAAGAKSIQFTSFVSPKAIPQMKDAKEMAKICLEKYPDIDLFALIPNLYGARTAWELGLHKVSFVLSLSESHNKANINRTREESLKELGSIRDTYPELEVICDIATAFACPFEGVAKLEDLIELIKRLYALGIREFVLCDTVGMANPAQVREYLCQVKGLFGDCKFQVHIHDTRNMGMVNSLAAVECGADGIQAALGGLGGCPFAPGASGNTSTEDLVYMLEQMGYDTGFDFDRLLELAKSEKDSIRGGGFSGHHISICNCS